MVHFNESGSKFKNEGDSTAYVNFLDSDKNALKVQFLILVSNRVTSVELCAKRINPTTSQVNILIVKLNNITSSNTPDLIS